jgi:hypothetical protein
MTFAFGLFVGAAVGMFIGGVLASSGYDTEVRRVDPAIVDQLRARHPSVAQRN